MQLATILHLCSLIINLLITAGQGRRHGTSGLLSGFLFCLLQSSPFGSACWSSSVIPLRAEITSPSEQLQPVYRSLLLTMGCSVLYTVGSGTLPT